MTPLTEDEAHRAEALANGRPCGHCGRPDDWLAEYKLADGRVVLTCDDCMQTSIAVTLKEDR